MKTSTVRIVVGALGLEKYINQIVGENNYRSRAAKVFSSLGTWETGTIFLQDESSANGLIARNTF